MATLDRYGAGSCAKNGQRIRNERRRKGKAVRATLILLIGSLCVGCAHQAPNPPSARADSATLALPIDVVWERTMRVLAKQKPVVQRADQTYFFITTEKTPVRLTATQADCGTYAEKPYLTDTRTRTAVAYAVSLRADGTHTSVVVTAEIEGRFQGTATHETTTALSCVSRGALERDLIRKIQQGPAVTVRAHQRR
jgi:hypothetical protein